MAASVKRRPFHRGLDRDAVLTAALHVLDTDGRAALTMRRVAKDLDVEAASLYTHVTSKDDLVDGVLDHVLDRVTLPADDLPWRDALVEGFTRYRRTLVDHPAVVALMTERARMSSAQVRLVERSIELLERAGLTTAQAVAAQVTLAAYTIGFVAQEVGRAPERSGAVIDVSPVMQRAMAALLARSPDERFRAGLDLILGGVTTALPRSRRRRV